jgi:hypothetical protein
MEEVEHVMRPAHRARRFHWTRRVLRRPRVAIGRLSERFDVYLDSSLTQGLNAKL